MIPTIDFYLTDEGQKKIFSVSTQNTCIRLGLFIDDKYNIASVIYGKIEGSVFSLAAAGKTGIKESQELDKKINKEK